MPSCRAGKQRVPLAMPHEPNDRLSLKRSLAPRSPTTVTGPERHFATLGSSRSNVVALVVGSTGQRRSSFQVDRPVA